MLLVERRGHKGPAGPKYNFFTEEHRVMRADNFQFFILIPVPELVCDCDLDL